MIPKILHQVWIGHNPRRPDHLEYLDGWRRLHPDWEYKLWTDENLGELDIKVNLDDWPDLAGRADIIRAYAVLKYGGVYADCDTEFVKNFDLLLNQRSFAVRQQPWVYCNAMFGAEPCEAFLEFQCLHFHLYRGKVSPWGVMSFSRAVMICPPETLYPPSLFFPYMYGYGKRPASDFPAAYSVHHWDMSWTTSGRH